MTLISSLHGSFRISADVPSRLQAYQSPRLSLLGDVISLTEAGSAGTAEGGNCTDNMGMTNRVMC